MNALVWKGDPYAPASSSQGAPVLQVDEPVPAPTGPVPIPLATLLRLRSIKRLYAEVQDATVEFLGYPLGQCILDLDAGLLYPPGSISTNTKE